MAITYDDEAIELQGVERRDPIVEYMINIYNDKTQINCIMIEPISRSDDPTLFFKVTAYDENCSIILEKTFKINNTAYHRSIDGIRSSDDPQDEFNDEPLDSADQYTRMFEDAFLAVHIQHVH